MSNEDNNSETTGDAVIVEKYQSRGELVLNRPHRKNALTGPMVDKLILNLESLIEDDSIKVIMLRGAEGFFCAGNDLKEFSANPPPEWLANHSQRWTGLHEALFLCPKPLVCVLEGAAIAAGSALALACDLIITGNNARLHVAEASEKIKKTPHLNTVWLMWRYGPVRTLELAMTAIPLTGKQLFEKGMAIKAVEDSRVLEEAREYADKVCDANPEIMASVKETVRELSGAGFRETAEKAMRLQQSGATSWQGTTGLKDN